MVPVMLHEVASQPDAPASCHFQMFERRNVCTSALFINCSNAKGLCQFKRWCGSEIPTANTTRLWSSTSVLFLEATFTGDVFLEIFWNKSYLVVCFMTNDSFSRKAKSWLYSTSTGFRLQTMDVPPLFMVSFVFFQIYLPHILLNKSVLLIKSCNKGSHSEASNGFKSLEAIFWSAVKVSL